MKKVSKIILTCLLITITLSTMFLLNKREDKKIYQEEQQSEENKFLTLMIEKEAGTGNYEESTSAFPKEGYYFNDKLSKCENGSKIKYNEKEKTVDVYTTKGDKCYVYFDYDKLGSICRGQNIAECFTKNYKKDETIYYHDESLVGGAEDESYRYAGSSEEVKNFVCLDGGTTSEGKCGSDDSDLYRIIGIFKNTEGQYEMKLIKYDYATTVQLGETGAYKGKYSTVITKYVGNKENLVNIGGYYWTSSSNQVNEWAESALRETNLNNNFLKTYLKITKKIDIDSLITNHTWSLNGYTTNTITPKNMYDNEMDKTGIIPNASTQTKTVENKIGLMYVSDYGYAASPISTNNWNENFSNYNNYISNNWMYMGLMEWTISRTSANRTYTFSIISDGYVASYTVYSEAIGIRPTFYLTSNAQLKSGNGTYENPYRLAI